MFCPKCQATYREDITRCADCEVALLAVEPPKKVIGEEKYKTFWRRFGAGCVDNLLFYPLRWIEKYLLINIPSNGIIFTWFVFHSWVLILYSVLMLAWRGQTIGKMVCGVKVLDVSGNPIGLKQAVMRDLPLIIINIVSLPSIYSHIGIYRDILLEKHTGHHGPLGNTGLPGYPTMLLVLSGLTFAWFFLEFVTMLTNNKRRAVHDFIAGTIVVKLPSYEKVIRGRR